MTDLLTLEVHDLHVNVLTGIYSQETHLPQPLPGGQLLGAVAHGVQHAARALGRAGAPAPVPLPPCDWREAIAIDPVMLFRFSALTFNGHRIHYDRSYATEVERYPGLVVHGPLQAILLFDAALRRGPKGARPAHLQFRGMRPLFDFDAVSVCGRMNETGGLDLFTANGDGAAGMQANLGWAAA
jgi:hydroxyacyl-ACP dehydratase HTD2-like protein with hotdog domain